MNINERQMQKCNFDSQQFSLLINHASVTTFNRMTAIFRFVSHFCSLIGHQVLLKLDLILDNRIVTIFGDLTQITYTRNVK